MVQILIGNNHTNNNHEIINEFYITVAGICHQQFCTGR